MEAGGSFMLASPWRAGRQRHWQLPEGKVPCTWSVQLPVGCEPLTSTVALQFQPLVSPSSNTGKNGFMTATKLGTTNKFFVAATKYFAAATKSFVDKTEHFVVVTKYFCYPYFNH